MNVLAPHKALDHTACPPNPEKAKRVLLVARADDRAALAGLLGPGRLLRARWDDVVLRLVDATTDDAVLGLHTQNEHDMMKLTPAVPLDQVKVLRVRREPGPESDAYTLEPWEKPLPAGSPAKAAKLELEAEVARFAAMSPEDRATVAPQLGVKWDAKASPETMCERLARASLGRKKGQQARKG